MFSLLASKLSAQLKSKKGLRLNVTLSFSIVNEILIALPTTFIDIVQPPCDS